MAPAAMWLPGAEVVAGNSGGAWTGPGRPKLVLHTTEGTTVESAVAAYTANNSWPHLTVDPTTRRIVQHLPLDVPARALRNTPAPGETNLWPGTVQIEIVGSSLIHPPVGVRSVSTFGAEELGWLGVDVIAPVAEATGIPLEVPYRFVGEAEARAWGVVLASPDSPIRMSHDEWANTTGIVAHQRVPENDHWDCGDLDIDQVVRAARWAPVLRLFDRISLGVTFELERRSP
jgi:hypothetical protein